MPTNHDETIAQRYQREGREHLDMLAMMTPEQIRDLELQAHNALCDVDRLNAELAAIKAGQGEAVACALKELANQFLEAWPDHKGKYYFLLGAGLEIAKAAKPASADAVSVPVELLERHLKKMACHPGMLFTPIEGLLGTFDELSALLAQSQEVK